MKYEVPVCEMLEFGTEDVITTSFPGDSEVSGSGGAHTPTLPVKGASATNDGGMRGITD